jgi:hypothetical protein
MTPFFLIEVIKLADSSFSGQPLKFRVVATCATKGECDQQAERRARANPESGFDPIQDAWWGKSGELVCCYYQAMTRPRGRWSLFNESIGAARGHEPARRGAVIPGPRDQPEEVRMSSVGPNDPFPSSSAPGNFEARTARPSR